MSPLLEALVAASKVGFDAPRCSFCTSGTRVDHFSWPSVNSGKATVLKCAACRGTGLDASDPERLIGRAEQWLMSKYQHPRLESYPTTTHFSIHGSAYGVVVRLEHESHNRTPEGRATALLRLVARVGGEA